MSKTRVTPYKGTQPYIFVSYAHANIGKVMDVIKQLSSNGYRVWYDDAIDPGSEWADNIATKIKKCTCLIAMVTKEYLISENCKDELSFARENGVKILLVYLENIRLSDGLELRNHRMQSVYKYKYLDDEVFFNKLFESYILLPCKRDSDMPEEFENTVETIIHGREVLTKDKIEDIKSRAESENVDAILQLASMYENGSGVKGNSKKAFELYLKAAELGSVKGQLYAGKFYKYGIGTKKDEKKGFRYIEKAALSGESKSLEYLADAYKWGEIVKRDVKKAIELYQKAYEAGNKEVASNLGNIFYDEEGFIDKEKAAYWLELSVQNGNYEDANLLGKMYLIGEGVEKDKEVAAHYLLLGEEMIFEEDQILLEDLIYSLARMYIEGKEVTQDTEKGIRLLQKAAKFNISSFVCAELGRIYEEGDGVIQDESRANEWYEKASDAKMVSFGVLIKSAKGRRRLFKSIIANAGIFIMGFLCSILISKYLYSDDTERMILNFAFYILFVSGTSLLLFGGKKAQILAGFPIGFSCPYLLSLDWIFIPVILGLIEIILGIYKIQCKKNKCSVGQEFIFIGIIILIIGGKNALSFLKDSGKAVSVDDEIQSEYTEYSEFTRYQLGCMEFQCPSTWTYEIDADGTGIEFDLYNDSSWDYINIYMYEFSTGGHGAEYIDYSIVLDQVADKNSIQTKTLVSGVRGYKIEDIIEYNGKLYDIKRYLLLWEDMLYIIECSSESPMSTLTQQLYDDVVQSIYFNER